MPTSTRHRMPAAVLIGCLSVLAAPPAAVAAPNTASPTAAPSPSKTPKRVLRPAPPAPPPVTVDVTAAGSGAPTYRIQVRNAGRAPVDATIRQSLPPGASPTSISAGGQAIPARGRAIPGEVTWQVKLPATSTTTLSTAITPTPPKTPVSAPACAFARDGSTPYDCATATWENRANAEVVGAAPIWRRPPVLFGALMAMLLLTAAAGWWWQRRRRRLAHAFAIPEGLTQSGRTHQGTIYPRPSAPRTRGRRRRPPAALVVGTAVAILAALIGVVGLMGWTATTRVSAASATRAPSNGAWVGRTSTGTVGTSLRDASFEFTVYRMVCSTASTSSRQCQATVGVRNLTGEQQHWYASQQRAYLPNGNWVNADESATRAVSQGRNAFDSPVPANGQLLLPLVFTVKGPEPPTQLELRSGVFSAGVRVTV